MSTCPKCGADYKEGDSFCSVCGEALSKTCIKCRATMDVHERFCKKCGFDNSEDSISVYEATKNANKELRNKRFNDIFLKVIIAVVIIAILVGLYFAIGYDTYHKRVTTYGLTYVYRVYVETKNEKGFYNIIGDIEDGYIEFYFFDDDCKLCSRDVTNILRYVSGGGGTPLYMSRSTDSNLARYKGKDFDLNEAQKVIDDRPYWSPVGYRVSYSIDDIYSDFDRQRLVMTNGSCGTGWIDLYPNGEYKVVPVDLHNVWIEY